MLNSIQHFEEKGIKKLEKVVEKFAKDPTDMATFINGVTDSMVSLGLDIIRETLEDFDQVLRESPKRCRDWYIVKQDRKTLTTSLGDVVFNKTLFQNQVTGERSYLLDRLMEIEPHTRVTDDAVARMLKEAVQTSYRKAGEETSLTSTMSKQAVKRTMHHLDFPQESPPAKKKSLDYLYIDADEDHVNLQFREMKGDLETGENGRKKNGALVKLVYVYEGVEPVAPRGKRHKLIEPHYFCGIYDGEDNRKLWDEVYGYLDSHYDLENVKKVYLNSDAGPWIKAGKRRIAGVVGVLDEFHLEKYLIKMTGHMLDSTVDANRELREAIRKGTKDDFREVVERLKGCTDSEVTIQRINNSAAYILSNWTAAKLRLQKQGGINGCSVEGHVSHVLASRMSSRPMGWSRKGADKMAHLRAYYWNGGDMLELARYQHREYKMAAGAENDMERIVTCADLVRWEKRTHNELGKYVDSISHTLPWKTRVGLAFMTHLSDL